MNVRIKAEWDELESVMIHTPGIEVIFGLLEPNTFLYERYFSLEKGLWEHKGLELKLRELGVKVFKLKNLLIKELRKNKESYVDLILNSIKFEGMKSEVSATYRKLEEAIKEKRVDPEQLYNILILNPTIRLQTEYPEVICKQPLANLMFMRDQQIITDKGLVIGKLSKSQRRREPILTELAFKALGIKPVYKIKDEGTLEGGDYIPMKDFALIGLKPRTNKDGINQLLKNKCLGFDEVIIVEQPIHPDLPELIEDPQLMMHLDTWLNVASSNLVISNVKLLKNAKIEIYGKGSKDEYEHQENTTLYDYLINRKHFNVFNLRLPDQLCYASNFLTIKDKVILAIDVIKNIKFRIESLREYPQKVLRKYGNLINKVLSEYEENQVLFPHYKELRIEYGIDIEYLALPNITGGYGGVHCMTCALKRK